MQSVSVALTAPWLSILGIGEDGIEGLSDAARALIAGAEMVVGGARHLALAAPIIAGERMAWPHPLADALPTILARRPRPVAVLASGDPFCHGVGSLLAPLVAPGEMVCLPAPSAFSLAAARLGWALQDASTLSLCGRDVGTILPLLQPGRRLLALSADATTPGQVAALLAMRGFSDSRLILLEALGGPRARVRVVSMAALPEDVDPLNLLAIEVVAGPDAAVIPLTAGLPDSAFEHDGQLTKRDIRAVTLAALAPTRGGLLWDIGAGAGSVGIEWMLRDPANRAIAIEARADRADRAARNAVSLGVPGLRIERGMAPDALAGLPAPDAVFVGGGAQHGAIDTAWLALKPGGRLVANAVSVETEMLLFAAQARLGGEVTRLSVERLDHIGRMRAFRPAMTVTQFAARKPLVVAAGIGCRRDCPPDDIVHLVREAARQAGCTPTVMAAPRFKAAEPGLREAASCLGLPLVLIEGPALETAQPCTVTRSTAVERATGFASIAEAAALAASGPGAVLLLPRLTGGGATCAIARGAT